MLVRCLDIVYECSYHKLQREKKTTTLKTSPNKHDRFDTSVRIAERRRGRTPPWGHHGTTKCERSGGRLPLLHLVRARNIIAKQPLGNVTSRKLLWEHCVSITKPNQIVFDTPVFAQLRRSGKNRISGCLRSLKPDAE